MWVLADRLSVEIFANGGRVYMPMAHVFEPEDTGIELFSRDGKAAVPTAAVFELRSAWTE